MDRKRWCAALGLLFLAACEGEPRLGKSSGEHTPSPSATAEVDPLRVPSDLRSPPLDAERSATGLVSKVLRAGSGNTLPRGFDRVGVYYTGWTEDGRVFASSFLRGAPATFRVDQVIAGWREGLLAMRVGEKRRLWIPADLGFAPESDQPQGALVIDVELQKLVPGTPPLPAPSDLLPPSDAVRESSGLRHRSLKPATSDKRPDAFDRVRIGYAGWDTLGKMIDSSQPHGAFAEVVPSRGFPGWRQALLLLREGEQRRFWIPEALAYGRYPGAIRGALVFDIELFKVIDMQAPPPVPKDVARAPRTATRTPSGLAYRVVKEGVGQRKPGLKSKVDVHYTYWTPGGRLIDSTVPNPQPQRAGLSDRELPPGLVEALQHMVVGETLRLWVPEALGFPGQNKPAKGMLVFDLTLLSIYENKVMVDSVDAIR